MHKRVFAIALCLVMVSAFTVTSAVSATSVGKSNIRTFDVYLNGDSISHAPIGKATLNLDTGHLVVNVNMNKIRAENPQWREGYTAEPYLYSPNGGWMNMYTPSGEWIYMSGLTADGTATLDTYIDHSFLTDYNMVTYFWNDPDTIIVAY